MGRRARINGNRPWREHGLRLEAVRLAIARQEPWAKTIGGFAEGIGTYRQQLNNWRLGKDPIHASYLIRIADKTGVPTDWILRGRPEHLPHVHAAAILEEYDRLKNEP